MNAKLTKILCATAMLAVLSACEKHLEHNQNAPATQSETLNKRAPQPVSPAIDSQGPAGKGA